MITKDLMAASSKPFILSILADGENYGYAILQRVHEVSGRQIEWSEGCFIRCCTGWRAKD